MDRNAYRDEDDTDQPDTYWRRRVLTLIAGLALLGILAWAFSGGGGKPAGQAAAAYGTSSADSTSPKGKTASASPAISSSPAALANGLPGGKKTPSAKTTRAPASSPATLRGTGTAGPSSQPPQATVEPGGGCAPSSVVLSLFTSKTSYSSGQDPEFSVFAVSTGSQPCTFAVGPAKVEVVVMSSGRIIWDSSDCAKGSSTKTVRLKRGVPVTEKVSWNRTVSLPGCVILASSARAGTYQVQARSGSVSSPVRTFKLTH